MSQITFKPSGKMIDVKAGTVLIDALRLAGVEIEAPCGGEGVCGRCLVRVISGDVDSSSLGLLPEEFVKDSFALACKTIITDSHLTVDVPEQVDREEGKFVDSEKDQSLIRHRLFPKDWQPDPMTSKLCVDLPEPQLEDGLSDLDRLTRCLEKELGNAEFVYPLSVIRSTADSLRREDGRVTVTVSNLQGLKRFRVIKIEAGDCRSQNYGVAVDIGTTTVALQLVSLTNAEIVSTKTAYNDQIECGLDVISRINYARRPERLEDLRSRVLNTVNRLIVEAGEGHGITPEDICSVALSGNTTMIHLLLGLKPEYIRLAPYTPTVLKTPSLTAGEVGIQINPASPIYISPAVGSYVGGDITAGLLSTDIATETKDISLFMDIGTNGELVIGSRDFLMACACSAGPAFEGGGIECGMRASVGAIERVEIDPKTGTSRYSTIGNVPPRGICGSGMISLLANLFLTGWIDAAGKLSRDRDSQSIRIEGRRAYYTVVPAEESSTGKPIIVSEIDFENIIRTKAAIYSASSLMLKQVGMKFADLANIYIAGGFGRFLDIEKAIAIGLIPDLPREKFKYLGNSSLAGTYLILVSKEFRKKQSELANRMTYMELNTDPNYMDQYTSALFLPHTESARFPTVHV